MIKSNIVDNTNEEITFPSLLVDENGQVVLGIGLTPSSESYFRGVRVFGSTINETIGHFSERWDITDFSPLPVRAKVELQNS